ncbi:MAG: YwhD family protein [Acidibacillus sp.]|uniref:Uncharacterized protein n=1 Tax=Sulfoacidibacillus ferrooxidans TaxID=2005001 RepID=A0A9X1V907_9BACL|nr:YwhD family protein [Sulfoacidibacillus ferrooxidans]MCI0182975.1 hypothetical protein [Sulfoacidibacillus ferrooxidans]MCY0893454.1 YwhD family protein [Acidibacillus sp.]
MEEIRLTGTNQHRAPEGLSTLSSLIIDRGDIYLDNGAIHGKAKIDQGIRYVTQREDVPHARKVVIVWLTLYRGPKGQGFNGVASCDYFVDEESASGYKNLAVQVNQMEKAVKGKVDITSLEPSEYKLLQKFVREFRPDLYEHASDVFLSAFSEESSFAQE